MGSRQDFQGIGVIREVAFSTYRKTHILIDSKCAQIVCDSLINTKTRYGFDLYAYVVMSNHVHFVFSLRDQNVPLSQILSSFKTSTGKLIVGHLRRTESPFLGEITTVSEGELVYRLWMPGGGYDRTLANTDAVWN